MPLALIAALAVSIVLHAVALFGIAIDLTPAPRPPVLTAELRPMPLPPPSLAPQTREPPAAKPAATPKKPPAVRRPAPRRTPPPEVAPAAPKARVMTVPESADTVAAGTVDGGERTQAAEAVSAPAEASGDVAGPAAFRLPPRGLIRFRVDRGDSGFAIGEAWQEWEFGEGRYRLHSVAETTGLVWLFRAARFEMESLGRISEHGLQPEVFGMLRNGRKAKERAMFDWETMKVRVGDRPEQPLDPGAQDLLSLYYQLGFLNPGSGSNSSLPIATGKKYAIYRLEVLGDEKIEVPLGELRTLHLRAPGENSTEMWLAYDYLMLPVKIRHVDSDGGSLVQVATEIKIGQ